jgi:negative regulator of sigma E activity
MSKQISTQATAFGLAAMVTLASLSSMGALANHTAAAGDQARAGVVQVQQVVIVGQRLSRS